MQNLENVHKKLKGDLDDKLKQKIKIPDPKKQIERWDKAIERAVKMATLGSISFVAASSAPTINPVKAAAHPEMTNFFLMGALLFVFCASIVMLSAFFPKSKHIQKILTYTVGATSFIGVLLFFLGALFAVGYLVF
jgi:hypothetical protein